VAFDMYLKLEGIRGESKNQLHRDWIAIESFSWGVSQLGTPAGSGQASGKPTGTDMMVSKSVDASSPPLFLACVNGEHIKEATLRLARNKNDQQVFLEYKLTDVLVSSVKPSGAAGGNDLPLEEVSLNFSRIEMLYREIDPSTNNVVSEQKAAWHKFGGR